MLSAIKKGFFAEFSRDAARVLPLLALILVGGCSTVGDRIESLDPKLVQEVASFKPPEPQRWMMPNGLTVIYLRDNELPIVRGRLMLRGGALWASEFPTGTTSAMGDTMRSGGAGALSADALDRELEKLAAGISSSFSAEFGSVSFSCLTSDVERVFALFSDVALRPRFEGDRLNLWKGQTLEAIRRRAEDPSTVAGIAFTQLVYGNSAYGRVSRSKDINSISRAELVRLHKHLVRPDGAILVLTGSIDQGEVKRLTERHFKDWLPRGSRLPAPPAVNYQPKPGIYFIKLPFAQSSIKLGQLGVPRFTPDYHAIDVFNEVFGSGGFGSRLMQRVRTELGLSYGIYGGISPGVVRGTNYIFVQTKAESTGSAIDESIGVLETLQRSTPAISELSEKKQAIANSYVFNFGSIDDIAGRMARQELLEYPNDYDSTYLSKIEAVQPEQVSEVARNRWNPAELVILIVGNEAARDALRREQAEPDSRLHGLAITELGFDEALVGGVR
jgi:zinc protease